MLNRSSNQEQSINKKITGTDSSSNQALSLFSGNFQDTNGYAAETFESSKNFLEMASYSWSYAIEGLSFEIVYSGGEYQLVIAEGTMDLNALWFSNGDSVSDGDTSLEKGEKSLNMNGEGSYFETEEGTEEVTWDSYSVYSETGLKGEDPLGPGTYDITSLFSDITEDELEELIVGVRATSVNGDDSVKLTSESTLLSSTPVTIDFETGSGQSEEFFADGYVEDGILLKTEPDTSYGFEGILNINDYAAFPGVDAIGDIEDSGSYTGIVSYFADDLVVTRENYNASGGGDEFDFVGGNFADLSLGGIELLFTGFNNGVVVFSQAFSQAPGDSGYIEVNANGIDMLMIADGSDIGDTFVMDNLNINVIG